MPREAKKDFELLTSFINSYNLSGLLSNINFTSFVSQQHKKYFSYLVLIAELQNIVDNTSYDNILSELQFSYLKESCSDSGIAFFSTFHGCYKSSKLLLRSSIETFLKGYNLDNLPDLDKETSLYVLFGKVKALSFFNIEPKKSIIDSIHHNYKLLCKDVHTASNLNMSNISALSYFPTFETNESRKISSFYLSLIPNYITLLCLKYNQQFHSFHFRNREIIISSIHRIFRPIINNI